MARQIPRNDHICTKHAGHVQLSRASYPTFSTSASPTPCLQRCIGTNILTQTSKQNEASQSSKYYNKFKLIWLNRDTFWSWGNLFHKIQRNHRLRRTGGFSLCWQILGLNRNCEFIFFFFQKMNHYTIISQTQVWVKLPKTSYRLCLEPFHPPSLSLSLPPSFPATLHANSCPSPPFQPPVKLEWQSLGRNRLSLQLQM